MPSRDKKKRAENSQPVSPRTPRATAEASFQADSSGDQRTRTPAKASGTSKAKLRVFKVTHDGHDVRGESLAVASSEGRARQLVGDVLVENDLGHTHGVMDVHEIDTDQAPAVLKTNSEGAILVSNGKRP